MNRDRKNSGQNDIQVLSKAPIRKHSRKIRALLKGRNHQYVVSDRSREPVATEAGIATDKAWFWKRPLIDDVLTHTPGNWSHNNYSNTVCYEVEVYDNERNNVLANFPEELKIQVNSVHRIQNPYMWGRFILRKDYLQAKDNTVQEETYYHPINTADKAKVMKHNLDYRRYSHKSSCQYNSDTKKPHLYRDPKIAKESYTYNPVVLVVVKTLKTGSDYDYNSTFVTRDWDTDYYPEYFVEF